MPVLTKMRSRLCLLFAASLCGAAGVQAQSGPYFPDRGYHAVYQSALRLQNPIVILSVAVQPGFEDLNTLSYLGVGRGASIVSLYVTNGETTPSDLDGDTPFRLAASRKVEALQVISYLGGKTYYLNLPDPGITSDVHKLQSLWPPDTMIARLTRAINLYRPDVILIGNDFCASPDDSARRPFLKDLVLKAVRSAALPGKSGWKVQRVFQEGHRRMGAVTVPAGKKSTLWKKSYSDIAREASAYYRSLGVHLKEWRRQRTDSYTLVFPAVKRPPQSLESGIVLNSARLKGLKERIGDVCGRVMRGYGLRALPILSLCVDTVDKYLGPTVEELVPLEKRMAVTWKNELERLRCAVLDLDITWEQVDSLVTERQLFVLKFKKMTSKDPGIHTQILFPGAMKEAQYIVNETNRYAFEFSPPQEFRIITPESMEFNTPVSEYGLQQPTLGTPFPFIIFHKDSVHDRNFVYRQEILLGVGPKRAVEIHTPVIRAVEGEPLIFSILNICQDPARGEAIVKDSYGNRAEKVVIVQGKNPLLVDTLVPRWIQPVPPGDDTLKLTLSGQTVGYAIARKFDVVADSAQSIGLITGQRGSAVEEAMRRLGLRYTVLDSASLQSGGVNGFSAIVFDRDVESQRHDLGQVLPRIRRWVEEGGLAVIFPQYASGPEDSSLVPSIHFERWPATEADAPVLIDSVGSLLREPNRLSAEDWQGWIVDRAMGVVSVPPADNAIFPVRSSQAKKPLVAAMHIGKGTVRFVSLDLVSQFLNVHPGSLRLFVNLLSPVPNAPIGR